VPVCAFAMLMAARFVPESRAPALRRFDPVGQLLVVVVLLSLTYAIIEGPTHGWTSATTIGLFVWTALGGLAFVAVERRQTTPLLELGFFRNRLFLGANLIAILSFVCMAGLLFLASLYLQDVRLDSALGAAVALLPMTAVVALLAPLTGRYVARRGPRVPLVASGLFAVLGMSLFATVGATSPALLVTAAFVCCGVAFGLVNSTVTNAALNGMPPEQAGVASAVTSTVRQLGSVLGVAVLGAVTTSVFSARLRVPATLRTGPRRRAEIVAAGIGGYRRVLGAHAPAIGARVRAAFADATHPSFALGAGCALAWFAIALVATRARARGAAAPLGAGVEADLP